MDKRIAKILYGTDFITDCRGLQNIDLATSIVTELFTKEFIGITNWELVEIPFVSSDIIVVCIQNIELNKYLSLYINSMAQLHCVCVGECDEVQHSTITNAIRDTLSNIY